MQKYKICPSCHSKNEPTLLECFNCEADLTRVKITDEETEKMLEENAEAAPCQSEKPAMVRVCECGERNPSNARKCKACGEDISDITPTPDGVQENAPVNTRTFVLSSLDGKYAYKVAGGETVIGRENAMGDYLATKSYVSRAHAKITLENTSLYIENLSGTNYIRPDVAKRILSSQVNKIVKNLSVEKHIVLTLSGDAMRILTEQALNNLANGGRGIGNVVENLLINPLSRYLFDNEIFDNAAVRIDNIDIAANPPSLVCSKE